MLPFCYHFINIFGKMLPFCYHFVTIFDNMLQLCFQLLPFLVTPFCLHFTATYPLVSFDLTDITPLGSCDCDVIVTFDPSIPYNVSQKEPFSTTVR